MSNNFLWVLPLVVASFFTGCQTETVAVNEPIQAPHVSEPRAAANDTATTLVASAANRDVKDVKPLWADFKKPAETELRRDLTAKQYEVTQKDGTEPAFKNEYWDNKQAGIYVDVVSGEPLFSSADKFHSGTGWPSFVQPLDANFIELREDNTLLTTRTEVRSKIADSHLGHIFDDGPVDRGGKRWCMNSAALRFVPKEKMEAEGYGKYVADAKVPQ